MDFRFKWRLFALMTSAHSELADAGSLYMGGDVIGEAEFKRRGRGAVLLGVEDGDRFFKAIKAAFVLFTKDSSSSWKECSPTALSGDSEELVL